MTSQYHNHCQTTAWVHFPYFLYFGYEGSCLRPGFRNNHNFTDLWKRALVYYFYKHMDRIANVLWRFWKRVVTLHVYAARVSCTYPLHTCCMLRAPLSCQQSSMLTIGAEPARWEPVRVHAHRWDTHHTLRVVRRVCEHLSCEIALRSFCSDRSAVISW